MVTSSDTFVIVATLRTSDPNIFAAGDVANAFHPMFDKHIRVEHWANARQQPKAAAAWMLGNDATYDELPYFFTDQYDLGTEYVGYVEPGGWERVVFRGDVAGMNVNVWDVVEPINTIIRTRATIAANRLADVDTNLADLARG